MSRIKGKDTTPEILVRKFLFSHGFRYRLYRKDLPGKPDIVLTKYKAVIFINGCFWHGHEKCKYSQLPQSNSDFWQSKIAANVSRDALNIQKLSELGWHVITIWQCELKSKNKEATLKALLEQLRNEEQ